MADAPLRYEPSELSRPGFYIATASLLASLAIAVGVSLLLLRVDWPAAQPAPALPEAGPGLDPHLAATRAAVEAEWQARATSYAWVEGEPEVARIPVERAAQLICAGVEVPR
jgi:hypothetical protein